MTLHNHLDSGRGPLRTQSPRSFQERDGGGGDFKGTRHTCLRSGRVGGKSGGTRHVRLMSGEQWRLERVVARETHRADLRSRRVVTGEGPATLV